jgi:hypothetical protein
VAEMTSGTILRRGVLREADVNVTKMSFRLGSTQMH